MSRNATLNDPKKDTIPYFNALDQVEEEVLKNISRLKPYNSAHEAYGVLMEEVKEFFDIVCQKDNLRNYTDMRKEAMQIAAVMVATMVEVCQKNVTSILPTDQLEQNITEQSSTSHLTFGIIKPHVLKDHKEQELIYDIQKAGFYIVKRMQTALLTSEIESLYVDHKGKDYYPRLVQSMMVGGPVVLLVLEINDLKKDAISEFRKLCGNTDPTLAEEGTLRKKYGTELPFNAIHAADSIEAFHRERNIFFQMK